MRATPNETPPTAPARGPLGWTLWARGLAARYRRATWRRRGAVLALLRRRAAAATLVQNRLAVSLHPSIRLSVALPASRQLVAPCGPTLRLGEREGARAQPAPRDARRHVDRRAVREVATPQSLWRRESAPPPGTRTPRAWAPAGPPWPGGRRQPIGGRVPLRVEALPLQGWGHGGETLFLSRLAEERQRVEGRLEERLERRFLNLTARREPAGGASRPDGPPRGGRQGRVEAATLPRTLSPAQAHAQVQAQVESLADQVLRQIDRRFTAYRERVGRVF